jgi:hypothetical protein
MGSEMGNLRREESGIEKREVKKEDGSHDQQHGF